MTIQIKSGDAGFGVWQVEVSTDAFEINRKTARLLAKHVLLAQFADAKIARKVKFDRRVVERIQHFTTDGPAQYWSFTESTDALPYAHQARELVAAQQARACDIVSDNHSDDLTEIWHGAAAPIIRCGFHVQQYGSTAIINGSRVTA